METFCSHLVAGLLREESFELGTEFVTAGQILVTRQQRPVLLSGDERIVLALQRRHHLSDFTARLDLLVDLVRALRRAASASAASGICSEPDLATWLSSASAAGG